MTQLISRALRFCQCNLIDSAILFLCSCVILVPFLLLGFPNLDSLILFLVSSVVAGRFCCAIDKFFCVALLEVFLYENYS